MRGKKGIFYSAALHGIILFLLIVGLPVFMSPQSDPEPEAITVELLPIAPKSNVKPQDDAPKSHETKEELAPKPHEEVHAKEEPKEAPIAVPVKPKQPPKEKPKPPKPVKPKPKTEDPLKSIFAGIHQDAAKEGKQQTKSATDTSKNKAKSTHYDPGAPLSLSDQDAIRQQVEINWNAPVGAKNAGNLKVLLHIEVEKDGTVTKVEFIGDQGRYGSDSFFRAAVDSAMRAVQRSSPLKNLPAEKYNVENGWSDFNMNFDPSDL